MNWRNGSDEIMLDSFDGGHRARGSMIPMMQLIEQVKVESGLERDWIWEDFFPTSAFVILAGSPKMGKSTFASHLAVAVSRGGEFLGRWTKKSNVLWLGLEERDEDVAIRFQSLGGDCSGLFYQGGPYQADGENIKTLGQKIIENNIGLVIVDTLSKFLDTKDENDAAQMNRALDPEKSRMPWPVWTCLEPGYRIDGWRLSRPR